MPSRKAIIHSLTHFLQTAQSLTNTYSHIQSASDIISMASRDDLVTLRLLPLMQEIF